MRFRFFIVPFIITLTTLLVGWWYAQPERGLWILLILLVGYMWAAWWLDTQRSDWWRLALTPWLLMASVLLFSLLLTRGWALISLLIFLILITSLYWRYVLSYMDMTAQYRPFTLERLSFNLNFLIIFFLAAALFGFNTFLDISLGISLPIFALCLFFLIWQRLWLGKAQQSSEWRMAVSIFVVTLEVFVIMSFLPFDFRVMGFLVAATHYAVVGLVSDTTDSRAVLLKPRLLFIMVILGCLAILATSRWY